MDPTFVIMHPMFIRTLLLSIEVAPDKDMSEDDQDIYRTLSKVLGLLTTQTTDATLEKLWAQAVRERHEA